MFIKLVVRYIFILNSGDIFRITDSLLGFLIYFHLTLEALLIYLLEKNIEKSYSKKLSALICLFVYFFEILLLWLEIFVSQNIRLIIMKSEFSSRFKTMLDKLTPHYWH